MSFAKRNSVVIAIACASMAACAVDEPSAEVEQPSDELRFEDLKIVSMSELVAERSKGSKDGVAQAGTLGRFWVMPEGSLTGQFMCMDVVGEGTHAGARVQIWGCEPSNKPNQLWRVDISDRGLVQFVGVGSNKCLDVINDSYTEGVALQIWPCHGGRNQQFFQYGREYSGTGSGQCIDLREGQLQNGTVVQQWGCHGGQNQKWYLAIR